MNTTPSFSRTVAAAAAITATFFAATACGTVTDASPSINQSDKDTPTKKTYPADGRENRNSGQATREYPADGRENRNSGQATREYPADGRENRNGGPIG